MDCIVAAGGVPSEDDPLWEYTRGGPKALLEIAGKPMVQWVVDALTGAKSVDRIALVALGPGDGISSPKLAHFIPEQGSMLGNAMGGADWILETNPKARKVLWSSSDIPLITPQIVDGFVDQCSVSEVQLHFGAISRSLMETRFPDSRRTYVHLTDGDFAAADIFVADPHVARGKRELWDELIGHRKSPLKQARLIGLGTLIKLALGRMSIEEGEARVSRAVGLTGKAVMVEHAELGMDVDKLFQLEICRRELAAR